MPPKQPRTTMPRVIELSGQDQANIALMRAGDGAASERVFLVTIVGADGALPLDHFTDGQGQAWQRGEGETEAAFVDRARTACKLKPNSCAVLLPAQPVQATRAG